MYASPHSIAAAADAFECVGVARSGLPPSDDIAGKARAVAGSKTYRDNPALVAIKVLDSAGMLALSRRVES
jgi:hypothetical protein